MTTKTLTGTYVAGYTLSASFSGLIVAASAQITGVAGMVGQNSTIRGGYDGGWGSVGVSATASTTVVSSGIILGGQGGAGGAGIVYGGIGGMGGDGLKLTAGGSVTVSGGMIAGGQGGAGGSGGNQKGSIGGLPGEGGSGIVLDGGGSIAATGGMIVGGQGGTGGYNYEYSYGGPGGPGADLSGSGAFVLTGGTIVGGHGGLAGPVGLHGFGGPGAGGTGVQLASSFGGHATFTNDGSVQGGSVQGGSVQGGGAASGIGLWASNATVFNGGANNHSATISGWRGINLYQSTLTNYGTIKGLSRVGVYTEHAYSGQSYDSIVNGASTDHTALIYGRTAGILIGKYTLPERLNTTVTNFGVIAAAPNYQSVVFYTGSHCRLIVETGSQFFGAIYGGGNGALELADSVGTISGLGSTATLSGATSATVSGFGYYVIDAGGSWAFTGNDVLPSIDFLTIAGKTVWGAGAGEHLALSGHVTVASTGSVDVSGNSALVFAGAGIVNAGLIETTGPSVIVNGGTLDSRQGGVISAGTGSKVVFEGADIIGGVLTTAGSGIIEFANAPSVLDGSAAAVTNKARAVLFNGATVTAEGAIAGTGQFVLGASTRQTALVIAAGGVTLSGGGVINLGNSANNVVMGATSAATLVNVSDKIQGGGRLGGGQLTLINQAKGVIEGTGAMGLTIDTGANTIVNAGLIWAADHAVTVDSAIANSGRLYALRSVLTLAGAVSGTGTAYVNAGTLIAEGAFGQNVVFNGLSGLLELSQSQTYAGDIVRFSTSGKTALDLRDIGFVSSTEATFSGTTARGVLTVTDGSHTAHITLIGNFTTSTFVASSDGHGGVTVVDPPRTPPTQTFVAAMAGLESGGATSSATSALSSSGKPPALAKPTH